VTAKIEVQNAGSNSYNSMPTESEDVPSIRGAEPSRWPVPIHLHNASGARAASSKGPTTTWSGASEGPKKTPSNGSGPARFRQRKNPFQRVCLEPDQLGCSGGASNSRAKKPACQGNPRRTRSSVLGGAVASAEGAMTSTDGRPTVSLKWLGREEKGSIVPGRCSEKKKSVVGRLGCGRSNR